MCAVLIVGFGIAAILYLHLHKNVLDEIKAKLHELTGPKSGP